MKNHSSPEPAAHSTLLSHFCARTFGKRYSVAVGRNENPRWYPRRPGL